jgi:hypothetical protein
LCVLRSIQRAFAQAFSCLLVIIDRHLEHVAYLHRFTCVMLLAVGLRFAQSTGHLANKPWTVEYGRTTTLHNDAARQTRFQTFAAPQLAFLAKETAPPVTARKVMPLPPRGSASQRPVRSNTYMSVNWPPKEGFGP